LPVITLLRENSVFERNETMNQPTSSPPYSIQDLRERIRDKKPHEAVKFDNALKYLIPQLLPDEQLLAPLANEHLTKFSTRIPAVELLDCFDGKMWAPALVQNDERFRTHPTLSSDYRASTIRCLKHATQSRLIPRWPKGLTPGWHESRQQLGEALPCNQQALSAMLEAGQTTCFDIPLTDRPLKSTVQRFTRIRDSFTMMGRHNIEQGIESPQEVKPEHIYGDPRSWYASQKALGYAPRSVYANSKEAWRILSELQPDLQLCEWPSPQRERNYGLRLEERPALLDAMLVEIFQCLELRPKTQTTVVSLFTRMLGYMQNHLGHDIKRFCMVIESPFDLAWLTIGGYPPSEDGRDPSPLEELDRIFKDEEYRDWLLTEIPRANRRHEARGVCRPNPFIEQFARWLLENNHGSTVEGLAKDARIILKSCLRAHKSQLDWLRDLYLRAKQKRQNVEMSPRQRRKQLMGSDPMLWHKLVFEARPRLRKATDALRERMESESDPASREYWRTKWAIALRNELLFGLLLALQLRASNLLHARLGEDYLPETYEFSIPRAHYKNGLPHKRQIPSKGPLADLMVLMDLYLGEARDILLKGREKTPYLFLSSSRGRNSIDVLGNVMMWNGQLTLALDSISRVHLTDLLPEGLEALRPHDFRDLWANYAFEIGDGKTLEAEGLGNTPAVAHQHYVSRTRSGRNVLAHLENLSAGRTKSLKERRKQARLEIKKAFGENGDPKLIQRIMRIIDEALSE
jgi:hypothetical protein